MNILVTRPEPDATQLATVLEQHGHQCHVWPAMAFAAPPNTDSALAFCRNCKADDIIIVGSKHVVSFIPEVVKTLQTHQGIILAIGKGTADVLTKHQIQVDAYPVPGGSDTLLALPQLQALQGKTVWLLRAQDGRELLPAALPSRGAKVKAVMCYQRVHNNNGKALFTQWQLQPFDLVIASNFSALDNLIAALGPKHLARFTRLPITVIGQKMLDLAKSVNSKPLLLNAVDNDSLVNCVEHFNDRKSSRQS